MDVNIAIEPEDGKVKTEIRIDIPPYLISQLNDKVQDIDKRYGPDRDIGPVTVILRDEEATEILIGTQKQGVVECYLDEFDNLIERDG